MSTAYPRVRFKNRCGVPNLTVEKGITGVMSDYTNDPDIAFEISYVFLNGRTSDAQINVYSPTYEDGVLRLVLIETRYALDSANTELRVAVNSENQDACMPCYPTVSSTSHSYTPASGGSNSYCPPQTTPCPPTSKISVVETDPLSWHLTGNALGYEGKLGTITQFGFHIITSSLQRWTYEAGGNYVPYEDNTYNIGSATNFVNTIYVNNIVGYTPPVVPAILELNGLTGAAFPTQTFAVATSGSIGSAPNIVSASGVHTFRFPLAGTGVTNGGISDQAQTIFGQKSLRDFLVIGDAITPQRHLHINGGSILAGARIQGQSQTLTIQVYTGTTEILTSTGNFIYGTSFVSGASLMFAGGTEGARLNPSRNFLVGTTTDNGRVTIRGASGASGNALYVENGAATPLPIIVATNTRQTIFNNSTATDTTAAVEVHGRVSQVFGNSGTVFGLRAATSITTAAGYVAMGLEAARFQQSGQAWVAIGRTAGQTNTIGNSWTAVGDNAAQLNTTGGAWTALGADAARFNGTNSNWTALGFRAARYYAAGTDATSFSNGVYVGFDTRVSAAAATNEIVIGYQAIGLGSNVTVIGNSSTTRTRLFGAVQSSGYTVATLPTGVQGMRAYVTDASTTVAAGIGTTVVGGGANVVPVFYDGTNWIIV